MTTQYHQYKKELADRMIEKWRKEAVGSFVELDEDKRELATLRAEVERMRDMLDRAKALIPAHNWVWHNDVEYALK